MAATPLSPVVFAPIRALPDAVIAPGSPVRDAFRRENVRAFLDACEWTARLPYGRNSTAGESLLVFEDRRGTCATKHGVIARLAEELGLAVFKNVGFYRLDDDIVAGAGGLLAPLGLAFVPQMHCFLEHNGRFVDLTAGNATGKSRVIDRYDFIVRVPAEPGADEMRHLYDTHLALYESLEPRLTAVPASTVSDVLRACSQLLTARCCAPADTV